jgi:putative transposase
VLGYSRQAYYSQKVRAKAATAKSATVLDLVRSKRSQLPRAGGRKLHHLIKNDLEKEGIKHGRDKLFDLLREHKLLIARRRCYRKTTDSRGWMRQFSNLTLGLAVTAPEQLWVSDITYVDTQEGTCYLAMITDAYSRRIMGYSIADNMEAATVAMALEKALKTTNSNKSTGSRDISLIHHSDRGKQYLSGLYTDMCRKAGIRQSTTQDGNPYHNALAERMNRTIKEEFCLDEPIASRSLACQLAGQAVHLYNTLRPHSALGLQTPDQVHKNSLTALKQSG